MDSMDGFYALPGLSVYAASKHALKAISDSLRVELSPFNISVSIIEPGSVETPIWNKGLLLADKTLSEAKNDIIKLYSSLIDYLKKYAHNPNGIPPDKVAKTVFHVLTTKKPKNRYLLGWDAMTFKLIGKLPYKLRDKILLWNLSKYGS